jgi:hypothetical protein
MLSENVFVSEEIFREFLVNVPEYFITHCRSKGPVKLFKLLLSPYNLAEAAKLSRNALFADQQRWGSRKFMCYFRGYD